MDRERRRGSDPDCERLAARGMTRLAIIVLSGSSPMKITGKTATAIARLTRHYFPPATGSTPGIATPTR
jgi:hypothetical protein